MNSVISQIVRLIDGAEQILLVCHMDPDGDAIGSLLGLDCALRRLGKQSTLACPTPVPAKYRFLPDSDRITTKPRGAFDLIISLDCSDTQRMGTIYDNVVRDSIAPLANIDHHITNVRFGMVNWVDTEAVATAEMVVELVEALDTKIDREVALPLLTGIVTDTLGFRTPNTTSRVLRIASRLIDAGVTLAEILERTLNVRSYSMICLWGKMLESAQLDGRIAWAVLTPRMSKACGNPGDGDGGFVNFLVSAMEADVGVIFEDTGNGSVEVGMRSKPGVSVAEVALSLGGGGHPQAAGCAVQGTLDGVRKRVLSVLQEAIADQHSLY